jgi:hypothetical protein
MKCFYTQPNGRKQIKLRRWVNDATPGSNHWHRADVVLVVLDASGVVVENPRALPLDVIELIAADAATVEDVLPLCKDFIPHKCAGCGFNLTEENSSFYRDRNELFNGRLPGEEFALNNMPPGAIYRLTHLEGPNGDPRYCGTDGRSFGAICPDGTHWYIDGPCSNCTSPNDKTHKCWVRHGEPPNFTVDKNGHTCSAGAGSIQTPTWHGFLVDGEFRSC